MLKKLKHKFILTNMLLVGIAVAFIFVSVCALTYRNERRETDMALEQILKFDKRGDRPSIGNERPNASTIGGTGNLPYIYAFCVTLSGDGTVTESFEYGADMEERILNDAITIVLSREENDGIINSLDLIYRKASIAGGGTKIAFASTERIFSKVKSTAFIAGTACIFSLAIFFLISLMLANIAIKPIDSAWKRQKQFIADASHDLKTPLTVILANNDIICSHKDENILSQMKWIESTKEEAEHMRTLVDKMLELADSESMKDRLVMSKTDISELTERTVLQLEPLAFENGATIESDIQKEISVITDKNSYVRLVHILIDNAIKYSPENGKVTVRLYNSGQYKKLSVKNTGAPIPKEDMPHIFERFYRADKARGIGGHGLGLSIAKNIAENLGAIINVQSGEKEGTVFTVTFKS
ncbi:MAG: sensor histidine kinase [Eubacteriales bacterium]